MVIGAGRQHLVCYVIRYAYAEYCGLDDLLGWEYARCSRWKMEGGTNGGRRRKRKGFPEGEGRELLGSIE